MKPITIITISVIILFIIGVVVVVLRIIIMLVVLVDGFLRIICVALLCCDRFVVN